MQQFTIKTTARDQIVDITKEVSGCVSRENVSEGICGVFTPHTTAAVTINENADRDVRSDMIKGLNVLSFNRESFDHSEGNSPAHIKSSLVGCSETIIITDGRPALGTWQGIYFCEFDGPRTRQVYVQVLGK